jgi:DNA sulfur modification protein DndD
MSERLIDMLKIKKVTIKGFGPYIDQAISFPEKRGVNIIWGDNGFGKTTFINALKFGFYQELPKKEDKDKSILDVVNMQNKKVNDYNISVIIDFSINDDNYSLTRYAKPKYKDSIPEGYNDFDIDFQLQKNGALLSKNDGKISLERAMPENTSRFFIFDGELLEEYNKLAEESQFTYKLKDSIEQILGVPILTKGKRHVNEYNKIVSNKLLQLSKKQNEDSKNYKKWEEKTNELKERENERFSIEKDRIKFQQEYDKIYDEIKKGPSGTKIKEYENLERELSTVKTKIGMKKLDIKNTINDSWRGLTYQRLILYKNEAVSFINSYKNKIKKHDTYIKNVDMYQISVHKRNCEICSKSLNNIDVEQMEKKIDELKLQIPTITDDEKNEYDKFNNVVTIISEKLERFKPEQTRLEGLSNDLEGFELDEYVIQEKMKDIQRSIEDFSKQREENVILEDQKKKALDNLSNATSSLKDLDKNISEIKEQMKRLESLIKEQIDDTKLVVYKEKEMILSQLHSLLEEGTEVFRNQLKTRVQSDAEKLFLKFSNQKDFTGLRINHNYGLDIVHSSGEIVPVKSSGFSHIVSLCLIGALHKNAPVKGPVFIDSPSGRLDQIHKNNLVNILTDISDQVVLLLYNGELDEQMIRKNLGSDLTAEFELIHENDNAFKTMIIER